MTDPNVTIGRLRKRIAKLTKARDYHRMRAEELDRLVSRWPWMRADIERWENIAAMKKRLKELEVTQTLLMQENERLRASHSASGGHSE